MHEGGSGSGSLPDWASASQFASSGLEKVDRRFYRTGATLAADSPVISSISWPPQHSRTSHVVNEGGFASPMYPTSPSFLIRSLNGEAGQAIPLLDLRAHELREGKSKGPRSRHGHQATIQDHIHVSFVSSTFSYRE